MKIKILPKENSVSASKIARKAADILLSFGAKLFAENKFSEIFTGQNVEIMQAEKAYKDCEMVLTIGGDGTLLYAAWHVMDSPRPLIGINSGRLGFLTTLEKDELGGLENLVSGNYTLDERSLLDVRGFSDGKGFTEYALNDAVLSKQLAKTISLDIYCDEVRVNSFCGDGVVFATPTGSTAYSMSAGGPIVDAKLGGIVMTQICPHIYSAPPMVFSPDRVLRVVPSEDRQETVLLACDGRNIKTLDNNREIFITQAKKTIPMVKLAHTDQMKSIDKKLKWR